VPLVVPAVWLAASGVWFGAHVDATGGRPLVVLWADDPGVFDPHATSHPVAHDIFRHVCEPLFYEDPRGEIHGLLAEDDFVFAPDGRTMTVTLRAGITFHDGGALDAAAVEASFERLRRAGVSPLAEDLGDVGVEAAPDGTVVFRLARPDFDFARLVLANPYAAVVSPRAAVPGGGTGGVLGGPGPGATATSAGALPEMVACTGPYRFAPELYRPDREISLVRSPAYGWPRDRFENRGPARIPMLTFRFMDDHEARFADLVEGSGCVLSIEAEEWATLAERGDFRLHEAFGGVTYLGFNFQRPEWQDERNRRAIALAVDKAGLAAGGPFVAANSPLGPNALGYSAEAGEHAPPYDPAASRRFLGETGLADGRELVLLVPESRTYARLAAGLVGQLAEVGLERVRIETRPRAEILSARQDFDLLLFDYAWGDYTALAIFLGPGPRNLLGYPGADIADMVRQARSTRDATERDRLVTLAQERVLDDVLWQPILVRLLSVAVKGACVTGEVPSPDGELLFHDATTHD
jgi:peptide/nickel transport system substrate-binding protein